MDFKNIGEVFKHKLSQRKFEMKDVYWKDAEQLIIKSNKKKKNKRILFFIMAIILLTTSLTWVFNFYNKSVIKSPAGTNEVTAEVKEDALNEILPPNNLAANFEEDAEKPPVGTNQVATDVQEDTLNDILSPNNLTADFEDGAEKVSVVTSESTVEMQEEVLPVPTNKDTIITQLANQPDTTGDLSKKSPFSLSLYGGILSVNKLLATSNQSFDKHVDRRKSEEQSIISYAAGIELNYHFKNWLISTGIAYNKLGEKINYSPNVNQQTDTIINDNSFWRIATFSYWTTDSIGNPMFVQLTDSNYIEIINTVDTTYTVTDNSIAEQNGITKLTYIEVPVLIGYEFHLKKLVITVRTGMSFGFLMRSKGYYLNRSNDQLLNISATSGLLNSFTLNYLLRIGANYKLNETITLFAEPAFNLNLNSH
ncbi:MAG: outer membrane beta-barrel protein [Bacteroidetes bacterium]|nr:outer membrane beta-barrel protein [Bacteroidota bacterium]